MGEASRAAGHDQRYAAAADEFGPALERLAGAYERDPDKCRDLLQEIHVALWRSLARFDGRCSLRTWVYRVAHNTATSKVIPASGERSNGVAIDERLESLTEIRTKSKFLIGAGTRTVMRLIHRRGHSIDR